MRSLVLFIVLIFFNLTGFAQITINLPLSRSVFQRDNNNASTIYISGIYENTLEKVEARLVPVKIGQGLATDWTIVADKPQKGSFTGSIKGTGGWYQLQVRGWKNGAVVSQSSVDKVGIGEVFLIAGQSNAEGKRNFGEKASVDDRVNCFDYQKIDFLDEIPPFQSFSRIERTSSIAPRGQGAWCWGELGDLLAQRLNVPIMFFNAAYEGTSIENWYSSSIGVSTKHPFFQFTFPNQTPYSYLRISLQYYISQLGLRSVLWEQGEAESELKTTQDYYTTALKKIIEKSRVETGKKVSWMVARASLSNTNQIYPAVINAQNSVINPADFIFEGPYTDSIQVPRPEGVHFTDAGISELAKAWDTKMTTRFFSQSVPFLPSPIVSLNASCQVSDKVTLSLPTSYSSQKWSNNTTTATLSASTGVFNSTVRDQTGNYFFTTTVDVKNVFPSIKPFAYAKKSPFFCEGTSTDLLTDSPDYTSFVWNTGETQKQITVKNTGSYSVRGISATGCASPESNIIQAQTLSLPGKPVIYQSDVAVCEGNTVTLASTSIKESVWSTNENAPFITLRTAGDYRVTVRQKDENGCLSPDSEPAIFAIKPRPETPEITQVGAYTLQAKQKIEVSDLTYEWKQDGNISSNKTGFLKTSNQSFVTVTALRNYTFANKTITCRSNLSGAYSFVPNTELSGIIIYPNPTPNGVVSIESKANVENSSLVVYNEKGQFVYSASVPNLSERRSVDLSHLASGKYILKFSYGAFVETKSIVISK
ncbi:MAG: T9SS type A sorting domain-containing protein [Emticicia sp.]|nr:T9SS type A sorting domain-containing protein [Emticicia sp.]